MKLIRWIAKSFEHNGRTSSRKLTAFWMIVLTTFLEVKYGKSEYLIEMLCINLGTVLLLMGIVTMHDISELKHGPKNNYNDTPPAPPVG